MFNHHFIPCWRGNCLSLLIFFKALGIEVANEFLIRLTHHSGESLEISNIQSTLGALDKNFVEEGFDSLPLCFLYVKARKVGKACCHHIPCRNRFFRVKVSRRGAERVDAKREPLAP